MKKLNDSYDPLYKMYHENSKIFDGFIRKIPNYNDYTFKREKKYYNRKEIKLTRDLELEAKNANLFSCIQNRKSVRNFDINKQVTFSQLTLILQYSYGITHRIAELEFRAVPSAGAKYPLELYIIANNVHGLEKGIYHYSVSNNSLFLIKDKEGISEFVNSFSDENQREIVESSGFTIAISGVFERTTQKYMERGYRFCLIEAGHLAQNSMLIASSMLLGSCAVGGFLDDNINYILDLNGVDESVFYLVSIGHENTLVELDYGEFIE